MKEKYQSKGFQVIGIHTPEFEYEKERKQVLKVVKRYKLDHPIMMDNDYRYWNALGNQYWPSFYLIDSKGQIVLRSSGEMHEGEWNAKKIENAVKTMLSL
ncbi:MAG: redoxin family protein [SAR324 cluster bacterium]|nr:redoxin family protein [SAR324 cluster bacterium]